MIRLTLMKALHRATRWLTAGVMLLVFAGAQGAPSLEELAGQALARMATRIRGAGRARVPLLCLVDRSAAAPIRDYVLRQQARCRAGAGGGRRDLDTGPRRCVGT